MIDVYLPRNWNCVLHYIVAMPQLQPTTCNLRDDTVNIVEKLLTTGKYPTYIAAFEYVYTRCQQRNLKTGFESVSFYRAYSAFRKWKSKLNQTKP